MQSVAEAEKAEKERDGGRILIAVLVVLAVVLIFIASSIYCRRNRSPPCRKLVCGPSDLASRARRMWDRRLGRSESLGPTGSSENFEAELNDGRYGCNLEEDRARPHWKMFRSPLRRRRAPSGDYVCLTPDQQTAAMFMGRVVDVPDVPDLRKQRRL